MLRRPKFRPSATDHLEKAGKPLEQIDATLLKLPKSPHRRFAADKLSLVSIFGRLIEHRVAHPVDDVGFTPPDATGGNLHLCRKRPLVDLAIEGGAAEPGAVENGVEPEDTVGVVGHGTILSALLWRPANRIEIEAARARGRCPSCTKECPTGPKKMLWRKPDF